ncbi:conserved membrane hypothetical protein [Frankia canadensis]|uniref:Major facilitator superfamily (MFS) profile domain-containing protein n=1 Tax=Frankia canadensis TaxID=1836972 RepID=A0A2I2KJN8_9ACTN|nr:MFS transporter [Frankia canadensis]SNQ45880.1 conserved membrane hypothetical protein [Frankia canadensis]SOU53170.1 conserved membrane hypothetical protein [Frankia canadensis]
MDGSVTGPARLDRRVRLTLGVLVLGGLMVVLDVTVTNVAIRSLSRDLHAPLSVIQWVTTAYTLALAVVVPVGAWLVGRLGARRVYVLALALFGLGSLLAGLAWDIGSLIAFRALQGLGGGLVNPVAMTITLRAAPPRLRGRAMGALGLPVLVGPLAGPTLGGWLVESSWRWIFLINVPVALVAVPLAWRLLPGDAPAAAGPAGRGRLDVAGLLMIGPGLAAFVYGLSESGRIGTLAAASVLVPALVGLALCAAFVLRALRDDRAGDGGARDGGGAEERAGGGVGRPLVRVRLLGQRAVATGTATLALFVAAYFGSMFILPLYWQLARGLSPAATGMLAIPQALTTGISLQVASRLVDRVPPGRVVGFGIVVAAGGMLTTLLLLDAHTPYWQLLTSMAVTGVGTGSTIMPTITTALRHLPDEDTPSGSTLLTIANQVAVSVGTALTSVLLATTLSSHAGLDTGADLPETVSPAIVDGVVTAFRHTLVLPVSLMAAAGVVALLLLPRSHQRGEAPAAAGEPAPTVR